MSLTLIHGGLSNACLLFSLIISAYGFLALARNRGVSGSFVGVLVVGELLFLAQAVVGVLLVTQGLAPARGWVHYLYGVVLLICLPGLYVFVRGRDTRREAFLYGLMGLVLVGISLRAMTTAASALP